MIFGIPEIYEYKKTCTDPKVLAIIRRWEDARAKNARWAKKVRELEKEVDRLKRLCLIPETCTEILF